MPDATVLDLADILAQVSSVLGKIALALIAIASLALFAAVVIMRTRWRWRCSNAGAR